MDGNIADILGMDAAGQAEALAQAFYTLFFGAGGRLTPICWVTMILIALAIWFSRRPGESFFAWLFPRDVYRNRSFMIDVQLWLFSALLAALGVFSVLGLAPAITLWLQDALSGDAAPSNTWPPVLVGLILFVVSDFNTYWVHRVSHEWKRLWPFHAVHHSAEVLNPITVNRKHPVYNALAALSRGVLIGLTQGLLLGLVIGTVDAATVLGANLFYYLFNITGANLRHTHIWLSYGKVLEHVFISPAQHQVHHSINPKHFNKNYGEVLAIWDWIFGSLYVPQGHESLTFGLADGSGRRIDQIHDSFGEAIMEPFRTAFGRKRRKAQRDESNVPGE